MAAKPTAPHSGSYLRDLAARHAGDEETRRVEATVVALIPRYQQVKVRDKAGHVYALTRQTTGVDLSELREGQRVVCTVTRRLPRVLSAALA
jgi:hypothetical protein